MRNMFDIFFTNEDVHAFRAFEDKAERSEKILKKLQSSEGFEGSKN
jgi:hypothetical protein